MNATLSDEHQRFTLPDGHTYVWAFLPDRGGYSARRAHIMPGGNGCELIARMRERQPGLQAIVLTGHPDAPDVKKAEQDDAVVRVVAKPFDAKRLATLITSAAQLSRTNRGLEAVKRARA